MMWLWAAVLVVLGLLLVGAVLARVVGALRRTVRASGTLNTAVTGRTARITAGLAEVRDWREARRGGPAA